MATQQFSDFVKTNPNATEGSFASFPAANTVPHGTRRRASDLGVDGVDFISNGTDWVLVTNALTDLYAPLFAASEGYLNINPSGATYSQSGTTVTVSWTAHTLTADLNGGNVYLNPSSGTASADWYSNFTYVDANTFTCSAAASATTSGNLGANTAETFAPDIYTVPAGIIRAGTHLTGYVFGLAKNSAGSKTLKHYFGGNLISQNSRTTLATIDAPSLANCYFTSATTHYIFAGSAFSAFTASNYTYRVSMTLAGAGDWNFFRKGHFSLRNH